MKNSELDVNDLPEKRLLLIGIQEQNLYHLHQQLNILFGSMLPLHMISLGELDRDSIRLGDVTVLSGKTIEPLVRPFVPEGATYITAERTPNTVNMKELLGLPPGRKILVINDNDFDTRQTADALSRLMPQHQFVPFLMGDELPEDISLVVTPGETGLVPQGFAHVMDIGPRVLAIETVVKIVRAFSVGLTGPLIMEQFVKALVLLSEKEVEKPPLYLKDQNRQRQFGDAVTRSLLVRDTLEKAQRFAISGSPVHIEGGFGTGKRMLAEMIHNASGLAAFPLYVYNCADKEPELIRTELFGELFGNMKSGTVFIKNINQLPYTLQGTLYDLIEGETGNRRIITSSTGDLRELMVRDIIRRDLYSEIAPYHIRMPSLSERKEDILALIDAFKENFDREGLTFTDGALLAFQEYDWPGNVRELYNVVSYCACLDTNQIDRTSLPLFFKGEKKQERVIHEPANKVANIRSAIDEIEQHGFLEESLRLLRIFRNGKARNESYGRHSLKGILADSGHPLSDQQLRLRMEVLNRLGLLIVRKGRAGTTISADGELFLDQVEENEGVRG